MTAPEPAHTIRDLLNKRFGVPFYPAFNRELVNVPLGLTRILRQDPSRIAFIMVNDGANDVALYPLAQGAPIRSFVPAANGGVVSGSWEEDGELISTEWAALGAATPTPVLVLETLIQKYLEGSTS